MATLKELCRRLDVLLQPTTPLQDYCPNGLQVEGNPEVMRCATAVSASLEVIERAIRQEVQALIVHHGLFWKGEPQPIIGVRRGKLKRLLDHGISLIAYHLPLDAHPELGNNFAAAEALGWHHLKPFGGIGVQGTVGPFSRKDFARSLEIYYRHPVVEAPGGPETIQTAALISGGAYRQLGEAAASGLDAFVTGNFDEPAWHQAFEEKINFFALGHFATERIGPQALATHIERNWDLPCTFLDENNPF